MRRKTRYSNLAQGLAPYFTRMSRPQPLIDGGAGGGGEEAAGGKQYATFVIAANDSTDDGKENADYVCDGTDDHVEINAALAATTPSTHRRVLLLEGTFNIEDDIVLTSNTVLEGQGDGTILTTGHISPNNVGHMFDLNGVSNVALRNLQIRNNYVYTDNAIHLRGTVSNIIIDNVLFYGVDNSAVIFADGPFSHVRITNCRFIDYDAAFGAIYFYVNSGEKGTSLIITDNVFSGKTDSNPDGINLNAEDTHVDPDDIDLQHIIVADNTFSGYESGTAGTFLEIENASIVSVTGNAVDWASTGIATTDCFVLSISGNTIDRVANGITCLNTAAAESGGGPRYLAISGNTIRDVSGNGIAVAGPYSSAASYSDIHGERTQEDYRAYAVIIGNTVRDSAAECISLGNVARVVVDGNNISGGLAAGIFCVNAWLIQITGNELSENQDNIKLDDVYDISIAANFIHDAIDPDGWHIWLRNAFYVSITNNRFLGYGGIWVADNTPASVSTDYLTITGNVGVGFGYEYPHSNTTIAYNSSMGPGTVPYGYDYSPPLLGDISTPGFTITGNTAGAGFVESDIRATGKAVSEWEAGTTNPAAATWNGRFSRVGISPPAAIPEVDIIQLSPYDAIDGRIYIIGAAVEVGGGTYESVTIVHGNNIHMDGGIDFEMNDPYDRLMMVYEDGDFTELSRTEGPGYTYGSNLVANPDVESGTTAPANWTAAGSNAIWSTAQSRSASHSLLINDDASSWTSDSFSVTAGTDYLIQASFYAPTDPAVSKFRIEWYDSGPTLLSSDEIVLPAGLPSWTTRQMFKTAPTGATTAKLVFENDNTSYTGTPEIYADDFAVKTYT